MSDTDDEDKICEGDGQCLERRGDTYVRRRDWICVKECVTQQCPNVVVCGKRAPKWYFDKRHGLCQQCLDQFGFRLHTRTVDRLGGDEKDEKDEKDGKDDEKCPVCYEAVDTLVEFPTDCNHWFCGQCVANLIFFDETRYHLSPAPFGCPPCPNGCQNPLRGRQCDCVEYDLDIDDWSERHPSSHARWQNAQLDSIENYDDMAYASKKCPLCRTTLE